jgi:N-acyl-L-homoserine lactone synthetase
VVAAWLIYLYRNCPT